MATFLKVPRSWQEAQVVEQAAYAKPGRERPLGYKTRLVREDDDTYSVTHWGQRIVTFHRDGSLVLDSTMVSKSTGERMNAFTPDGVTVQTVDIRTDLAYYEVSTPRRLYRVEKGETLLLTARKMRSQVPPLPTRTPGKAASEKRWS